VRYTPVIAVLAAVSFTAATRAQDVLVRVTGEKVQIAAPSVRFLAGKSLDSLRNGAAVAFDIQVSILSDGRQTVLRREFERFVVSYDLWEERFSVTRMRSTRAAASHLSAQQAEAWCLDAFAVPTAGLPTERQLWVRLDIHANHGRDSQPLADEGLSIGTLIELFSRPGKAPGVTQWRAESGAFTLAALQKAQPQ
jgi:hypothetical protein